MNPMASKIRVYYYVTYSPGTSPVRYSGTSERSKRPSGRKILLSGPIKKHTHTHTKRQSSHKRLLNFHGEALKNAK